MLLVVAFLGFATLALGNEKIHEKMSAEQVQQIFHTTHDSVPDYEVVNFDVSRLTKRGARTARSLHLNAFGSNLKLWLHPVEGILATSHTPITIAKRHPKGRGNVYEELTDGWKNVGTLMGNPATGASMMVKRSAKGQYSFDGFIASEKLVVRSLPDSLSEDVAKNRSTRNLPSIYHVVYERELRKKEGHDNGIKLNDTVSKSRVLRSPVVIPSVVYPEIMVVIDFKLYTLLGSNIDKVLAYAVTFWHGVDLYYRSFEEPKFRLNIARIFIVTHPDIFTHLQPNGPDPDELNLNHALNIGGKEWLGMLSRYPASTFDAIITLTGYEVYLAGNPPTEAFGLSYKPGGACSIGTKAVESLAIVADDTGFDGMVTAAHELAHLLGAEHDDDEPNCKKADFYIMAPTKQSSDHSHDFSVCTVNYIQTYLRSEVSKCLHNFPQTIRGIPQTIRVIPQILPGQMNDRNHQCNTMLAGSTSCYDKTKGHLPCRKLYCKKPGKTCVVNPNIDPPDGSVCDQGKICLHGQCVRL